VQISLFESKSPIFTANLPLELKALSDHMSGRPHNAHYDDKIFGVTIDSFLQREKETAG